MPGKSASLFAEISPGKLEEKVLLGSAAAKDILNTTTKE
jgi:hypothetical protein